MTIKKFKVFDWALILLLGVIAACVVATAIALAADWRGLGPKLVGATTATFAICTWRYWTWRIEEQEQIRGYTAQGMRLIVPREQVHDLPLSMTELLVALDHEIEEAIAFWARRYPHMRERIRAAFNGGRLRLRDAPIRLRRGLARGRTKGNYVQIMWRKEDPWPGDIQRTLQHELGHVILGAAGVPQGAGDGDEHHRVMDGANWA